MQEHARRDLHLESLILTPAHECTSTHEQGRAYLSCTHVTFLHTSMLIDKHERHLTTHCV